MSDVGTINDHRVGTRLGDRYLLDARIAAGGMAIVYRALDEVLGRRVAVKVMHPGLAADPGFVERFRREAQNAARLNHPNVAMVHDWGWDGDAAYMVMELVDGTSLRELLDRYQRLDADTGRSIVAGVAAALDHAHSRGIVHRDVKPENVMLTEDGSVKVVDFGVARALGPEAARLTNDAPLGTAAYIAPEQLTDAEVDGRADLYALGVMSFEMLTGRRAFDGDSPAAVAAARLQGSVPSPGISPSIDGAISRATALAPEDRFPTAGEFAEALGFAPAPAHLMETAEVTIPPIALPTTVLQPVAPPTRKRERTNKRSRRRTAALALAVLVLASAVGAAAVLQPWMADVPDLAASAPDRANTALRSAGLAPGAIEEVFSDVVPSGAVVGTEPAAGQRARRGSAVKLLVSKGPELLTIPMVVGKGADEARDLVERAGFEVGDVSEEFHDAIPAGSIAAQDPPPDAEPLKRGSQIRLVVSKGPDLVKVPEVSGRTPAQAKAALEEAGLRYSRVEEFSDSIPADGIIRTDPSGGQDAVRGSAVKVVVSKGPRPFQMPDLVGLSRDAAKSKARDLGLVIANEYSVPGSGKPKDQVQGQNPPAGTEVRRGTRVDIYYAA